MYNGSHEADPCPSDFNNTCARPDGCGPSGCPICTPYDIDESNPGGAGADCIPDCMQLGI